MKSCGMDAFIKHWQLSCNSSVSGNFRMADASRTSLFLGRNALIRDDSPGSTAAASRNANRLQAHASSLRQKR